MGVSRNNLDQIRNALNPLDIIRESVPTLKQTGNRWRGLCPFHNERTPSFFFMPEKGLWHCFGSCQEGGDIFKFVMRLDNLSFPEALRLLADKAGVPLEWERTDDVSSRAAQEKERLLGLLEEAAAFYHEALQHKADAEAARRFLSQKRKIKPDTCLTFRLGYASAKNSFLDAALRRGVPIEILLKAGLAVRSEKSGRYHDPLQNRVVFPIVNAYGQVIGFGGRVIENEALGPKYLNSPETPVYSKGRHLYGLFHGRTDLREKGQAVLVEGYLDVIACHQAGVCQAVAPLGTAFTKEQGHLLKRYVQEAVLLFDSDEAGAKASWRSADVLLQADLFVRVAQLMAGKDPDELIIEKGAGALIRTCDQAKDIVDFWLDNISVTAGSFQGLHGRIRQADELLRLLQGVQNETLRGEWLRKISRRLSLDEASLTREFHKKGTRSPSSAPARYPAEKTLSKKRAQSPAGIKVRSTEEELIQLLCAHPEVWQSLTLPVDLFFDLRCRAIYEKLKKQWQERKVLNMAALSSELNTQDNNWLTSLLVEEKKFDNPADTLQNGIRRLELLASKREYTSLGKEVVDMLEGRLVKDDKKIQRYQTLMRELKGAVKPAVPL